jgi:hypothetical protein
VLVIVDPIRTKFSGRNKSLYLHNDAVDIRVTGDVKLLLLFPSTGSIYTSLGIVEVNDQAVCKSDRVNKIIDFLQKIYIYEKDGFSTLLVLVEL